MILIDLHFFLHSSEMVNQSNVRFLCWQTCIASDYVVVTALVKRIKLSH